MTRLTYTNYRDLLYNGARVRYDNHIALILQDPEYNGGFNVEGRSILNLLENFDVFLLNHRSS